MSGRVLTTEGFMGIRPWNIDALRLWQRVLPMIDLIANPVSGVNQLANSPLLL